MLRIYGQKQSRALRCMWVLEELQVPFEHSPLNQNTGETRTAEFLKLNPSGKIPVMDHDGFILSETVAINWYLADTFSTASNALLSQDRPSQARIQQWTSWALTEVEPPLVGVFKELRRPAEQQQPGNAATMRLEVRKTIATTLEPQLIGRQYLIGPVFTLADLNVASILSPAALLGIDLTDLPNTDAWMKRCLGRDAHRRAQSRA